MQGNHDIDGGSSKETVLDYWNSMAKYYSFDTEGTHFIVLGGNDMYSSEDRASSYACYIREEQMNWLTCDLC